MLFGGYIIKRFNLRVRGILKLCIGLNVVILFCAVGLITRCKNIDFAGVSVDYNGKDISSEASEDSLENSCNSLCDCTFVNFAPVCGDNDVMYFNPCAAGCLVMDDDDKFDNCTCVMASSDGRYSAAKDGKCSADCNLLPVFLPIFAVLIFLSFSTDIPGLAATLRCVPDNQRSFAVSIQWIIVRCLGSIPGPIIFGAVIDETSLFWKESCESDTGACYFYDNDNLSNYFTALSICCKVVVLIMFTLSLCLYKPPPSKDRIEIVTTVDGPAAIDTAQAQSFDGSGSNGKSAFQND